MVATRIWSDVETRLQRAGAERRPRSGLRLLRAAAAALRAWRARERCRHDLAAMSARDFGDIGVPLGIALDETRKWPWQKESPQWQRLDEDRRRRGGR